jgi:putative N6-adenine-specific DNA methylase
MEAVLKMEIAKLGLETVEVEDGKVTFAGDENDLCRANIFLRTTERILLKAGRFKAVTFDELFEKTKAIEWEKYIPADGKFWVTKANSVKSKLFSPSDIQSIMKKAIVERLKPVYKKEVFPENGADYPIRVSIVKDIVTIGIDTSGESLHKRGYRKFTAKAPITETLASALIMLTPWNRDRIFADPFCGSGTFPIEAAMMALNIAPGVNRSFTAENWKNLIPKKCWYKAVEEANDLVKKDVKPDITGSDIDAEVLSFAKANAKLAGVDKYIRFSQRSVSDFTHNGEYGFMLTNPPYGERLEEKEALKPLYGELGKIMKKYGTWSYYVITSYEDAEAALGQKAAKNRKIYNGMIKTYFYQFPGPKPPKKA